MAIPGCPRPGGNKGLGSGCTASSTEAFLWVQCKGLFSSGGCSFLEPESPSADVVRTLIDGGSDANARDKRGETPLTRAVLLYQFEVVAVLLKAGADASLRSTSGSSALEMARSSLGPTDPITQILETTAKQKWARRRFVVRQACHAISDQQCPRLRCASGCSHHSSEKSFRPREWGGQSRPPVQGLSLFLGGDKTAMTDSSQ